MRKAVAHSGELPDADHIKDPLLTNIETHYIVWLFIFESNRLYQTCS